MEKVKTTIRIDKKLKQMAEKIAIDKGINFQDVVNEALYNDLVVQPSLRIHDKALDIRKYAKSIDKNMGNLNRSDFYD